MKVKLESASGIREDLFGSPVETENNDFSMFLLFCSFACENRSSVSGLTASLLLSCRMVKETYHCRDAPVGGNIEPGQGMAFFLLAVASPGTTLWPSWIGLHCP